MGVNPCLRNLFGLVLAVTVGVNRSLRKFFGPRVAVASGRKPMFTRSFLWPIGHS
jgi:hypothetical protein